jgi:hypothetical protein
MNSNRSIWLGALLGGWIGGFVPLLWGADYFSFATLLCNGGGALLGIYLAFKLTHE